jgi:hypothetical protein
MEEGEISIGKGNGTIGMHLDIFNLPSVVDLGLPITAPSDRNLLEE